MAPEVHVGNMFCVTGEFDYDAQRMVLLQRIQHHSEEIEKLKADLRDLDLNRPLTPPH